MIVLQVFGAVAGVALIGVAGFAFLWWLMTRGDRNPFE